MHVFVKPEPSEPLKVEIRDGGDVVRIVELLPGQCYPFNQPDEIAAIKPHLGKRCFEAEYSREAGRWVPLTRPAPVNAPK